MDLWTLIVSGLVILPGIGLVAVLADLFSAYNDLIIVRHHRPPHSIEAEQAKHNLWAQAARASGLIIIAVMASASLADSLDRNGLAFLIYMLALVLVADAFRARRSRKKIIRLIEEEDQQMDDARPEPDASWPPHP